MTVVLDASALMALLGGEQGINVVTDEAPGAAISAVKLSEVIAKLADGGMPEAEITPSLMELGLEIKAFDAEQAYTAVSLRPMTRSRGLSFEDRACIALGLHLGCSVLTSDRNWVGLDLGVEVRLIR